MKKIGLLIPCTNLTVEYELQHLYNLNYFKYDKITFYISKLEYKTNYKDEDIAIGKTKYFINCDCYKSKVTNKTNKDLYFTQPLDA